MDNTTQNRYNPDIVFPPGDTLLDTLEERGMSQAELALKMGRPKKMINEIIRGKAAITPQTALQLERVLGIPARFWNNRERRYREYLTQLDEKVRLSHQGEWGQEFPLAFMSANGWLSASQEPVEQLCSLLNFFGIAEPGTWDVIWEEPVVDFYKPEAGHYTRQHLSVWLRQGEIEAQEVFCKLYDAKTFRDTLQKVRALTNEPQEGGTQACRWQPELVRLCAEAGVAVVFVPQLPTVPVNGATRWLTSYKALIQLTQEYKTDDELWFTFFHEAGHILLHGKREFFLEHDSISNEKEDEADRFATRTLIPPAKYRHFISQWTTRRLAVPELVEGQGTASVYPSKQAICTFAAEIGIAPSLVVRQLQQDKLLPETHCNDLKRTLSFAS